MHRGSSNLRIVKYPNVPASNFPSTTSGLKPYFYKRVIEILTRSQANMGGREKRCQDIDRSLLVEICFKFLKSRNISFVDRF